MRPRTLGAMAVAPALIVALASIPAHAEEAPGLDVAPSPVETSGTYTVSGSGCLSTWGYSHVYVSVDGTFLDTAEADDQGHWSLDLTAPSEPGDITITASCDLYTTTFDYTPSVLPVSDPSDDTGGGDDDATVVTATIGEISRDKCVVSIPVTTTGADTFTLNVWDDGTVIDTFTWTTVSSAVHTVNWLITRPALKDAVGVGFYVTAESRDHDLAVVDPYEYPDETSDHCSAQVPVTVTIAGSDTVKKPGSSLEATGSGFFPGETVHVTLGSEGLVLGSFVVGEDGTFTGSFTVPADLGNGTQGFTFTGGTSGRSTTVPVVIDDGSSPAVVPGTEGTTSSDTSVNAKAAGVRATRTTELARTGVDGDQLLGMLALTAILGACGTALRTRSRRSATED